MDKLTNYLRFWQASGGSEKTSIRIRNKLQMEIGKTLTGDSIYSLEDLSQAILTIKAGVSEGEEKLASSIKQFTEQISGYAEITELNFKIINQLIEKNLVSELVKTDGQKTQRLTIRYKFIGVLEPLE